MFEKTTFTNGGMDLIVALDVLNQEKEWTIKLKKKIEEVGINHK